MDVPVTRSEHEALKEQIESMREEFKIMQTKHETTRKKRRDFEEGNASRMDIETKFPCPADDVIALEEAQPEEG